MAKQCLLVISLPASDTTGSPHTIADDVEVGGERGRAALDRLRNVVGRVEASWRPASAEEGFEIVRRRLFEPLVGKRSVRGARHSRPRVLPTYIEHSIRSFLLNVVTRTMKSVLEQPTRSILKFLIASIQTGLRWLSSKGRAESCD